MIDILIAATLGQDAPLKEAVDGELSSLLELYRWFHANPELSLKEEKTSARFAAEVRAAGWTVTEKVGGWGVVATLKNGDGPAVLARIDMDALPIKEETGLPYASVNGAMHACGHDVHLSAGVGLARALAKLKDKWSGTVILIGQPAEETGHGAKAMLEDPAFAKAVDVAPVAALSIHDTPAFPAGTVSLCPGYSSANADSIDIKIFGKGGHGAWPHQTIDPVVIAAEMILAFQTIVARKIDPTSPAVVTVGSIHGGSKHNIIPDEVTLQLTLRSYDDAVRQKLIDEVKHVAKSTAETHRAIKAPEVVVQANGFPAVYHDPGLVERLRPVFAKLLGESNVKTAHAAMGAEDFGRFATHWKIPGLQIGIGGAGEGTAKGLHNNKWAPIPEPTVRTATLALTRAVMDFVPKG